MSRVCELEERYRPLLDPNNIHECDKIVEDERNGYTLMD